MGLISRLRTAQVLRGDAGLRAEHESFSALLDAALESPAVTALLSNYVHQDDQDYQRREMFLIMGEAFGIGWQAAVSAYADMLDSDSTTHVRFVALLNGSAPYTATGYRDLLLFHRRKPLVDRMIYLVRRG